MLPDDAFSPSRVIWCDLFDLMGRLLERRLLTGSPWPSFSCFGFAQTATTAPRHETPGAAALNSPRL